MPKMITPFSKKGMSLNISAGLEQIRRMKAKKLEPEAARTLLNGADMSIESSVGSGCSRLCHLPDRRTSEVLEVLNKQGCTSFAIEVYQSGEYVVLNKSIFASTRRILKKAQKFVDSALKEMKGNENAATIRSVEPGTTEWEAVMKEHGVNEDFRARAAELLGN